MTHDEYSEYREYLREGARIEIGIPLSGGGVFRDWAIISEAANDELVAQISRDVLPAEVRFEIGFILDVSIRISTDAYTCSAIVIEKLGGRVLRIGLFGAFNLRERRQFFRVEMGMRVKYGIADESSLKEVEMDWEVRKEKEQMRFQGYDDFVIAAQMARFKQSAPVDWNDILFARVNLGGGGICVRFPQTVQLDQLLNLELFLPLTPPRQVHTVGQVVHLRPPLEQKDGSYRYDAGLKFIHLDERDRDLIFKQISVKQIDHLRKKADKRDIGELSPSGAKAPLTARQLAVRAAWILCSLLILYSLAKYLISYKKAPPPNQIEQTYEKSLRKYRHLDNQ